MSRYEGNRRTFLRDAAGVAGGLVIGFHLPGCSSDPASRWGGPKDLVANANLRITPDNRVIFTLARVEMGQGTLTSQVMIVAEELDLSPSDVEVEFAPNHADFAEPEFGVQVTGGSTSTRNAYPILSQVGATAREALFAAGAIQLGARTADLVLVEKTVAHAATGRSATFGELAEAARGFVNKVEAEPKPRHAWRVVGRNHTRLDAQSKVDGSAKFGADDDPEGLETAVLIRGPLGSNPIAFDGSEAQKVRGVKDILTTPYGVAVVAERYHQARKAANLVKVDWTPSEFSTDAMFERYVAALSTKNGTGNARSEGDAASALAEAEDVLDVEYRLPFLAHATMEPQNCTASVTSEGCEVWAPTQGPMQCAIAASDVTGLPLDKIKVHQTLLGGGFGRRGESDFVTEAVWLSKARGKPVRVQWSREDDVQHDFYRPASLHRLRGAVKNGAALAWEHRIVQQSALVRPVQSMLREVIPSALTSMAVWAMTSVQNDGTITEGADTLPYGIKDLSVGYQVAEEPVPVGFWRSVGHSSNGFVVESFIDELSHKAGADPVAFRKKLLAKHPRHLGVLERATKEAGWGKPLPKGRAQGVAVHESFKSFVAVVAEVSVEAETIQVHKLTAAVDCGLAIHPDGVRAQIEGGMIFALGPTLENAEITFEKGRVMQSNFHDFPSLRFSRSPEIAVHIVDSEEPPSGVGEPGVPPTAPAVANAVFALTKKRLRSLPLRLA